MAVIGELLALAPDWVQRRTGRSRPHFQTLGTLLAFREIAGCGKFARAMSGQGSEEGYPPMLGGE